jgi:hypothetical protein
MRERIGWNNRWIRVISTRKTPVQPETSETIILVVVDLEIHGLVLGQRDGATLRPSHSMDRVVVRHHDSVDPAGGKEGKERKRKREKEKKKQVSIEFGIVWSEGRGREWGEEGGCQQRTYERASADSKRGTSQTRAVSYYFELTIAWNRRHCPNKTHTPQTLVVQGFQCTVH